MTMRWVDLCVFFGVLFVLLPGCNASTRHVITVHRDQLPQITDAGRVHVWVQAHPKQGQATSADIVSVESVRPQWQGEKPEIDVYAFRRGWFAMDETYTEVRRDWEQVPSSWTYADVHILVQETGRNQWGAGMGVLGAFAFGALGFALGSCEPPPNEPSQCDGEPVFKTMGMVFGASLGGLIGWWAGEQIYEATSAPTYTLWN